MKNLVRVVREYRSKQTISNMFVSIDGKLESKYCCVELPDLKNQRRISCIPEGIYEVIKHQSPKFRASFWIKNVPGRSEILIHRGNWAAYQHDLKLKTDSLGCLIVGLSFTDFENDGILEVKDSAAAIRKMYSELPNKFTIEISSHKK